MGVRNQTLAITTGSLAHIILLLAVIPVGQASGGEGRVPGEVADFLEAHCLRCHGPEDPQAGLRVDELSADQRRDRRRWRAIGEQLRHGLMPPESEPRPSASELSATLRWIDSQLASEAGILPNHGNLIPHELLFGTPAPPGAPPAPRVWRMSPDAYLGFVRDVHRGRADGIVQPFTLIPDRGLKDFAGLYSIDEPGTEILVRNAELIVAAQTAHEFKDGKVQMKNDTVAEFKWLLHPGEPPTPQQLQAALDKQFVLATGRPVEVSTRDEYLALYQRCRQSGSHIAAARTMLTAVLLRPDAIHRYELGGRADSRGWRRLTPHELARALGLSLSNRRIERLHVAAAKGELETHEGVVAALDALLFPEPRDGGKQVDLPRLLGFFQEYFDYTKAPLIFKEPKFPFPEMANEWNRRQGNWPKNDQTPRGSVHRPQELVLDTDRLILHVLEQDHDVFRTLLTTDLTYTNIRYKEDKSTRRLTVPVKAVELNAYNDRGMVGPHYVYGFSADEWPSVQPARVPSDRPRLGVLMQPAWLVAHSTNFENDPVRRGRWIRERLLGGTVPDLPIGVAAQVPDEPHRTLRNRLEVTREARCWKCHQQMDELGLPFEQFDHYGVHRTAELIVDREASDAHVDANGKPLGKVLRPVELLTMGRIERSGDTTLDGPVGDPYEYVRRLADSERARQVFVRHAFRYYLGRNETVADAHSLQQADEAYVRSQGSFKRLVISLLTSDSFLYRRAP